MVPADCAQDFRRKSTQETLGVPVLKISSTGLQASLILQMLNSHLFPLWPHAPKCNGESKSGKKCYQKKRPGLWAREKPQTWEIREVSQEQENKGHISSPKDNNKSPITDLNGRFLQFS